MNRPPGELPATTPGPLSAIGLLGAVAVLFVVGGIPLQILLGETGMLLAQVAFLLAPAVLFVVARGHDLERTLSLKLPSGRQVWGGLLCLCGGIQIAWVLAWIQGFFVTIPVEYLENMSSMLRAETPGQMLMLLSYGAIAPAVCEEVLFRGVVLSGFRRRLPTFWAIVGVGIVFGVFHLSPQTAFRFLPTAWLGALLAWIVVVSGSLPLAIGLHFANNASILILNSIPTTSERVSDPEQSPSLLLVPVAIAMLAWGIRIIRKPATERSVSK